MNASGMSYGNRQEEVSTISRSLKGLAKELNIPIIALSQLNRSVEQRGNADSKGDSQSRRPQLSDLRESGAIEQDADMVCFIHRPEYYKIYSDENGNDIRGQAEIIIAKHRNGAVGDVRLRFIGEYTRFQNLDDESLARLSASKPRLLSSKMNTPPSPIGSDSPIPPPPPMDDNVPF
jgi:replicative DNA helicase